MLLQQPKAFRIPTLSVFGLFLTPVSEIGRPENELGDALLGLLAAHDGCSAVRRVSSNLLSDFFVGFNIEYQLYKFWAKIVCMTLEGKRCG